MMKHSKIGMSLALVFSALAVSASAQSSQSHWSGSDGSKWKASGECVRGGFTDANARDCAAPTTTTTVDPVDQPRSTTVTEKLSIPADVFFAFDSAEIKPAGFEAIAAVVGKLTSGNIQLASVSVIGHTDSVGTKAYNQRLSERRAAAVKKYLVSKGVPADVIVTEGRNFSDPRESNSTAAGRAANRRVDIEIIANQKVTR